LLFSYLHKEQGLRSYSTKSYLHAVNVMWTIQNYDDIWEDELSLLEVGGGDLFLEQAILAFLWD